MVTAHPHVCGEHNPRSHPRYAHYGSSPRVWGARTSNSLERARERLIPTCVGSTVLVRRRVRRCLGSSPRVWGAHYRRGHFGVPERLIPTCVGSTGPLQRAMNPQKAHPHVCGEHKVGCRRRLRRFGSSPRVWGALNHIDNPLPDRRLIPTCVGSTFTRPRFSMA